MPGIQIGELFPKLAKQADKFSLIRSMTHGNNGHETAAYLMQTGHVPGERLAYPSVGAVFSLFKGKDYKGLIPPYVVLTQRAGPVLRGGLPGPEVQAVRHRRRPERAPVRGRGRRRAGHHRRAAEGPPRTARQAEHDGPGTCRQCRVGGRPRGEGPAYELILGEGKEVFDLSKEKADLRDRYGRHTFGQECLVARRLVEAGVPYVAINYPGGWDTHSNHFATMRRQCPQLDQGLATLLADLQDRGLLESTLVWCCGEFGRTPKVDWEPPWNGGRNHHGNVFTVLVAGGGFKGGHVVGASDGKGEEVKDRPVYPVDLLGSIYQLAGIDAAARLPHPEGLEAHVLPATSEGVKSGGLLAEIM